MRWWTLLVLGACSSAPSEAPAPEPELPRLSAQHRGVRSLEVEGDGIAWRLEREDDGWWLVKPIRARAQEDAVNDMLAVLQAIELEGRASGDRASQWLAGPHAISVRVEGDPDRTFTVGRAVGEATFVGTDGAAYRAQGRFRRFFARRIDALRDPVITDLDPAAVATVTYDNRHGSFSLQARDGSFVPKPPIDDFFAERAAQQVAVVARLRARGFAVPEEDAGLDAPAKIHLELKDGRTLDVFVGRRRGRELYLRTSDGDTIYRVSAHLESSLVPRAEALRVPPETQAAPHDHPHDDAPSRLSPSTLTALRLLARAQANR